MRIQKTKITNGVQAFSLDKSHAYTYIVKVNSTSILVDPIKDQIPDEKIDYIFISHCHVELPPTLPQDKLLPSVDFDHTLFKVIHTPGHTNDSCSLYIPTKRILFTGDSIWTRDGKIHVEMSEQSLAKIMDLDIEHLLTLHSSAGPSIPVHSVLKRNK